MGLTRVQNPPNPWSTNDVEWLVEPPEATLETYEDDSRTLLSENQSPDVPFRWSVNPYRGCLHGCAYCYARPTHEYLEFGAGTDFERKLIVKTKAPGLLKAAFDRPSWTGEPVAFSGVTDCYQPIEATYRLTRQCLEVCLAYRNPVSIITKGALIERDLDLLKRLTEVTQCRVVMSLAFADAETARALEPYTPPPSRRIQTIRTLSEAGIPVGLLCAPVIPALNDSALPEILTRAREAGADSASMILLRLPGSVQTVFEARLRAAFPDRADRVLAQLEACRQGRRNDPRFGHRMAGRGPRWNVIQQLFDVTVDRLGFETPPTPPEKSPFRRPGESVQLPLF